MDSTRGFAAAFARACIYAEANIGCELHDDNYRPEEVNIVHVQLHVMCVDTDECLHWGPIGGSVINALHFARDNRGVYLQPGAQCILLCDQGTEQASRAFVKICSCSRPSMVCNCCVGAKSDGHMISTANQSSWTPHSCSNEVSYHF